MVYTLGICGSGMISDIYIKNLTTKFDWIKVKSICARHIENAQKKADEYGLQACTYEEMLADEEIDIIVVLTQAHAHYGLIKQALNAGKHVYTEKTITMTVEEAKEIQQLAKEKNLYLSSAPDTFLGSALQEAKRAIENGSLGEVTGFSINVNRNLDLLASFISIICEPGGGIGEDYGVYHLTALCSLLGPVDTVAAFEENTKPVRTNVIPTHPNFGKEFDSPNDNLLSAIIKLKSGVFGTLHMNGESILRDMAYIYIYGTKGILKLTDPNQFGGQVTITRCEKGWDDLSEEVLDHNLPYSENSRGIGPAEMAQAITEVRVSRTDCALAVHVLDVLAAMKKSSVTRQFVSVESSFEIPAVF